MATVKPAPPVPAGQIQQLTTFQKFMKGAMIVFAIFTVFALVILVWPSKKEESTETSSTNTAQAATPPRPAVQPIPCPNPGFKEKTYCSAVNNMNTGMLIPAVSAGNHLCLWPTVDQESYLRVNTVGPDGVSTKPWHSGEMDVYGLVVVPYDSVVLTYYLLPIGVKCPKNAADPIPGTETIVTEVAKAEPAKVEKVSEKVVEEKTVVETPPPPTVEKKVVLVETPAPVETYTVSPDGYYVWYRHHWWRRRGFFGGAPRHFGLGVSHPAHFVWHNRHW